MITSLSLGLAQEMQAGQGHLRLIFRSQRKNDRLDAERLAKLLYLGDVPSGGVVRDRGPASSLTSAV